MTPPASQGNHGFFVRNWAPIAICAAVGAAIASVLALVSPSGWEASVEVLVTRLAIVETTEDIDGGSPLEAEVRFANSMIVRDAVRGTIPTAPDAIDVSFSESTNVMAFRAIEDEADEATRLVGNWASAYINERRKVLVDTWNERAASLDVQLDQLILDLGEARLAFDEAETQRLERRREDVIAAQATAAAALDALRTDAGAEIFGSEAANVERTGLTLLPTALLGALAGAVLAGSAAWLLQRSASNDAEARSWLDRANEGSFDGVLTTRTLDIPSFLSDGDAELPRAMPIPGLAEPVAATPEQVPAPVPTTAPAMVHAVVNADTDETPALAPAAALVPAAPGPSPSPEPEPTAERPRMVPAAAAAVAASPSGPAPVRTSTIAPRPAASSFTAGAARPAVRPASMEHRRSDGPLRVVKIDVAAAPTTAPTLSRADQAWADDISLTTDR